MNTVAFYTQGCRLNQSETTSLERYFEATGYDVISSIDEANIVVVNTCTVTENGDTDTKRLVRKITRSNPSSSIALIGCQSQILKEKLLELPNVKWVVGNAEKMRLPSLLENDSEPMVLVEKIKREPFVINTSGVDKKHTRANIKIQDGCDFYCAFCVIPFARGPARSRVYEDIIRESVDLVAAGHQEIVVTGINVGTYEFEEKSIHDVLNGLSRIDGLQRIRISSIEPTTISSDIIKMMHNHPKLCPYLHIPLQAGSDDVLSLMNRKYTMKEFRDFVNFAYDSVDDICIGTDIIVGFPGETKEHFDQTVANLMTLPIHYFHVFSYSERQYARSKKMDLQVPASEIQRRSKILRDLSQKKRKQFYERFIGNVMPVLFEQKKHGFWSGLTDNYIRVRVQSDRDLRNKLLNVTLNSIEGQSVIGTVQEEG